MLKQVIVMRKDLNMRKGKMIAQGAHASMKVVLDQFSKHTKQFNSYEIGVLETVKGHLWDWLTGDKFTKIVLGVDSELELIDLYYFAKQAYLPVAKIIDNGTTEFHNKKVLTCIAIGPAPSERIDEITGKLKLL
jgi:peptidyl-tRNA hydrolase, PTH2 family